MKGRMVLNVLENGDVAVDMGAPILAPEKIPFLLPAKDAPQQQALYKLELTADVSCPNCAAAMHNDCAYVEIGAVSMGNPHAVLRVESVKDAPVASLGQQIQASERFPEGVNVGFMAVLSRTEIDLRVYERGVGETLACGTGACAAVVAGRLNNWLDPMVKVNLPGGSLSIEWQGEGHSVIKSGPATTVFEGKIYL